jgi:hypothetical protein
MADTKISGLTSYNPPIGSDVLPVVDVTASITKKLSLTNLRTWLGTFPMMSVIQTYTPAGGGTATLDLSKGNIHHITMPAGNITVAITNGTSGQCFIVRVLQDGGGSRIVTWFSGISWTNATAPILTTTGGKADTLGFEITTAGSAYDGFIVGQNI